MAALPFLLLAANANATDFTAGVVMTKMNEKERYTFLAGVAEGLAYARYASDGKTTEGMRCVYDWFYKDGTMPKIYSAFERFSDYLPGAVMAAMIEKECPH